jgi:hypothetical protein
VRLESFGELGAGERQPLSSYTADFILTEANVKA